MLDASTKKAEKELEDSKELLSIEEDPEMRAMIKEDIASLESDISKRRDELQIMMLPKDPMDERNIIIEVRAGTGGDEASLFAGDIFEMYVRYANRMKWQVEIISESEGTAGGYKEVVAMISGNAVYANMKFEAGTHRVQRVPETESQGRIHTSTVTVAVLVEADEVELEINPTDLKIDYFRASGAGGQHINKTESAIRITHLPTGTVVECQDERSQHKNRDKAMRILRSRILEAEREKQNASISGERKAQVGTGDRSERIRTYNYPQGRVSDHRINLTLYRIEAILNGDLDEIIDALVTADTAEKLKNE